MQSKTCGPVLNPQGSRQDPTAFRTACSVPRKAMLLGRLLSHAFDTSEETMCGAWQPAENTANPIMLYYNTILEYYIIIRYYNTIIGFHIIA